MTLKIVHDTKAGDIPGDFISRSRRSAKISECARCGDCDFRRSPRSADKIADIWHVMKSMSSTIFFLLLIHFSERFLERFGCKIVAAANHFCVAYTTCVAILWHDRIYLFIYLNTRVERLSRGLVS